MEVLCFDDPAAFIAAAGTYLEKDPFSSNVIAVHVDALRAGIRTKGEHEKFWVVLDAGEAVGLAMHTPPHNIFLSRLSPDAARVLAASVSATGRDLPGVSGEVEAGASFAEAWAQYRGQLSSLVVAMRMYRLGELRRPGNVAGMARLAELADLDVVAGWLQAFHDEADPAAPTLDWRTQASERVAARQLWLWEAGGLLTSLAGLSRPVAGVSRVGPVYTPTQQRRRGYGAAVTAGATAAALEAGADHVVLYTDLANPTSNAIYQEIGYTADHDAAQRRFYSDVGGSVAS